MSVVKLQSETSLVLRKHPSHNVLTHIEQAKNSLAELAPVPSFHRQLRDVPQSSLYPPQQRDRCVSDFAT